MFYRVCEAGEAVAVRRLTEPDVPVFLDLIDALADYEKLARPDPEARRRLAADSVGDPPRIYVLLVERAGRVIGYAVYFETYSTFLARPTLFLEDIFVLQNDRRCGAGQALMRELACEAIRRGCGRMEWQVLTWNTPAMSFYERCRAGRLEDWYTYRLTADQFAKLAEGS